MVHGAPTQPHVPISGVFHGRYVTQLEEVKNVKLYGGTLYRVQSCPEIEQLKPGYAMVECRSPQKSCGSRTDTVDNHRDPGGIQTFVPRTFHDSSLIWAVCRHFQS